MNFVWTIVFYFVGILVGSFGLITPILILRVSLPLIRALESKNLIDGKRARSRNFSTILLWAIIDTVVCVLIFAFASSYAIIGFLIGIAFVFVSGIRKTGMSDVNKMDFIDSYAPYIKKSKEEDALCAVMSYMA